MDVSRAYDVIDLKVGDRATQHSIRLIELACRILIANGSTYDRRPINMSFSGPAYPSYADEIAMLAGQGVITVAASGNDGSHATRESLPYPARLPDVIAVGSHDGNGRPTDFSNNGPGVDILADGERLAQSRDFGTSFAAPQVAATVTHVQAIVDGLTGSTTGYGADDRRPAAGRGGSAVAAGPRGWALTLLPARS